MISSLILYSLLPPTVIVRIRSFFFIWNPKSREMTLLMRAKGLQNAQKMYIKVVRVFRLGASDEEKTSHITYGCTDILIAFFTR